jgi:hypothetical protein
MAHEPYRRIIPQHPANTLAAASVPSQQNTSECRLSGVEQKLISGDRMSLPSRNRKLALPEFAERWLITTTSGPPNDAGNGMSVLGV